MSMNLDLTKVSRQRALNAWLAYHGIEKRELAKRLEVEPCAISRVISGKRGTARVVRELVSLGIPAELLPEPSGPPGRPRQKY
jgi:predicted transcriptional regulator